MADYIKRANLLDGISSPEFGLDEIIDELIYEHNLDFLHDNDEDAVREFAKDLIDSIKNYIKTEPTTDSEEVTRCKDCWNAEDCDGVLYCNHFNHNVYEDDFCSNGG